MMKRLGVAIGGIVMLALAYGGYSMAGHRNTLTCTRSTAVCVLERQTVGSIDSRSFSLASLTGAKVGTTIKRPDGSSRPSAAARLVLMTKEGEIEFTSFSTEMRKGQMAEQATEINAFVHGGSSDILRIHRDDRLTGAIIAVIPSLLGVLLLFLAVRR